MAKQSLDLFHSILIYQPGVVNVVDQQAGLFVVPFESFTGPLYGFVLHTQPSRGLLTVLVYDLLIGLTHTHTNTMLTHENRPVKLFSSCSIEYCNTQKRTIGCSWAFRLDVSTAPPDAAFLRYKQQSQVTFCFVILSTPTVYCCSLQLDTLNTQPLSAA